MTRPEVTRRPATVAFDRKVGRLVVADGRRLNYDLGHGDLLLMRGRTQHRSSTPSQDLTQPVGPRINLTFRVIVRPVQRSGFCRSRARVIRCLT
jgi:hypothetical protein